MYLRPVTLFLLDNLERWNLGRDSLDQSFQTDIIYLVEGPTCSKTFTSLFYASFRTTSHAMPIECDPLLAGQRVVFHTRILSRTFLAAAAVGPFLPRNVRPRLQVANRRLHLT